MRASTSYSPGVKRNWYRPGPNWSCSCWANTVSIWCWIAESGIEGSNTKTFGPNRSVVGSIEAPGVRTRNSYIEYPNVVPRATPCQRT
ncbi:hypothetical protein D3C74_328350 [compost metagenome]